MYLSYPYRINDIEPIFGYPLYFLTSFKSNPIWALNRIHLQYLINYIEAGLRMKPNQNISYTLRNQADHIPKWMKLAGNRENILKLLKKLQQK